MKPTIIIPPGNMSNEDKKALTDAGFVVVTSKNPTMVRFLEPPPSADRGATDRAAIRLVQAMMGDKDRSNYMNHRQWGDYYAKLIVEESKKLSPETPKD